MPWRVRNVVPVVKDDFSAERKDSDIADALINANPRSFNPQKKLTADWQRVVIHGNTVDVFEACILIALESVGATARYIVRPTCSENRDDSKY